MPRSIWNGAVSFAGVDVPAHAHHALADALVDPGKLERGREPSTVLKASLDTVREEQNA